MKRLDLGDEVVERLSFIRVSAEHICERVLEVVRVVQL